MIKEEREAACLCGPVEKWPAGMYDCPTCGKVKVERDLTKIPISAWGRHELEAEVKRMQEILHVARVDKEGYELRIAALERTGGAGSVCLGNGRQPQALGACPGCDGQKTRDAQVEQLILRCNKLKISAEEAMQKADAHRRQRDALQKKPDALERK